MKKYFLLSSLITIGLASMAQTKASFGIKAGVTQAAMQGNAINSLQSLLDYSNGAVAATSKTGFYGGAYVSIPIADNFSIEPGLYYAQKGYELAGSLNIKGAEFLGINAKAQLTNTYIDLPLLAKATFNGFQVFAGPQVSYLASSSLRTRAGALGFNVLDKTMDTKSSFNQWDMGITGGVGYQFANGMNLSASYDHGLSRVDASRSVDSYNRVFKVGIGFRL